MSSSIRNDEYANAAGRINGRYFENGHRQPQPAIYTDELGWGLWVGRYCEHRFGGVDHETSIRRVENEICQTEGKPLPFPPPPVPELGALSVRLGRLWDGQQFIGWRGVSEFSALHLARIGDLAELVLRFDRAKEGGCNGVRVLAMAKNLFDLKPSQPGYWAALDTMLALANERGLYLELCIFADAQDIMPAHEDRLRFAHEVAAWATGKAGLMLQLSNEPWKNGWQSAVDPQLLEIAQKAGLPGIFSIGDPIDQVTDATTGNPLRGQLDTLSNYSQVLVLHGERKMPDGRYAGWVDHLKGFDEVYTNPRGCYRIHDEPMGAASTWQPGRRDNRPDAHRAAALVCAVLGIGFTYHYIAEQDPAQPGLDGQRYAQLVPQDPEFTFKNAGTGGASVVKFQGWDKVRTCDNGREAYAVMYGHTNSGMVRNVEWAPGWTVADRIVIGPSVELHRARKA